MERVQIPLQAVMEHLALYDTGFAQLRKAAMDREIMSYFGLLLGLRPAADQMAAGRTRFLAERSLTPEDLAGWLRDNAMSESDFAEFIGQEVICRRLRQWIATVRGFDHGARAALNELRARGAFVKWAQAAAEESVIVDAYKWRPEYRPIEDEDPAYLAALHAANTGVRITGDAKPWAEEPGFDGTAGLIDGLRRSPVCTDVKRRIERQMVVALQHLLDGGDTRSGTRSEPEAASWPVTRDTED